MISKKNLWYLMLLSIIVFLSVYYVTMPNDLLSNISTSKKTDSNDKIVEKIEEASSLVALRVNLQEERQEEMTILQKQLTSDSSSQEKNDAYEKLKYLNEIESLEEENELKLKNELKLDCFVKIDNNNINCVCISPEHDETLANKVMRLIQSNIEEKKYITVKFQKN